MSEPQQFVLRCLAGLEKPEDIDDWVEGWHNELDPGSLAGWLGMTDEEYARWVSDPACLGEIIEAHRHDIS